jgi:hypothetical protein
MAPYLINHPQLISRWIEVRETALARIAEVGEATIDKRTALSAMLDKAAQHLAEISIDNELQSQRNSETIEEIGAVKKCVENLQSTDWRTLFHMARDNWGFETQELVNSLMTELYPQLVDDLEESLCLDESMDLVPEQSLSDLRDTIERVYGWALDIDFSVAKSRDVFWYRSSEKSEPRLGRRGIDAGEDKSMKMTIAYDVRQCYDSLLEYLESNERACAAEFAIQYPKLRCILRRIQTMAKFLYGDIHANLSDADVLPIHLLRCKLSFFGVSKFDPKSRLWVRNTMFQGAPVCGDIGEDFADDWYFPVMPFAEDQVVR